MHSVIKLGWAEFDPVSLDLRGAEGRPIALRHQSARVLAYLAARQGRLVSKADLIAAVWPDTHVTDDSLFQCIRDIRQALGDRDRQTLRSVPRKGYMLAPDGFPPNDEQTFDTHRGSRPRIAVLPFDDFSTGADANTMSDAIAEGVTTELARFRMVDVISRNTCFQYRGGDLDICAVAQKLQANWLIEGSQRKVGDRLRVNVQLINGRTGVHSWAGEFVARASDLFTAEAVLVRDISRNIGREVAISAPPTVGRANDSALYHYLRGNALINQSTKSATLEAHDHYQRAIHADPKSPFGYIGMALVHRFDLMWGWVDPTVSKTERLRLGAEAAETALLNDPNNARAHLARAEIHVLAGELEEAIVRYESAAKLNPSESRTLAGSAEPLVYLGRTDEAIEIITQAIDRDPAAPGWYFWNLGWACWAARRNSEGIEAILRMPHITVSALRDLAALYAADGQLQKARETMAKFLTSNPGYTLQTEFAKFHDTWRYPETMKRKLNDLRAAGMPA